MKIGQRRPHITDRVQHVRANNQVERLRKKFLLGARLFQIKNLTSYFGKGGELLQRSRKESRRNIREGVGMKIPLQ